MRSKEERGGIFVCRALGTVALYGSQKWKFPEGFNYDLWAEAWGHTAAQVSIWELSYLYTVWLAGICLYYN